MTQDKTGNSDENFTCIEPASISLSANTSDTPAPAKFSMLKNSPLIWMGLGVLLCAALVVVFLLPGWVSDNAIPDDELTASVEQPPAPVVSKPKAKEKISPWEKAQESQLRKETQEVLSQMLESQKALADRGAQHWAAEQYDQAMQLAVTGDDYYNERNFVASKVEYEKALAIFSSLVEEMDMVFKSTIERGNQALADGNSMLAKEAFDLALAIDAIDRTAINGRERADKLDEVLQLMDRADSLLEKGSLDEARLIYQQVSELDEHFEKARQQIELADKKIIDRKFNNVMSEGFAALESKRYSKARAAFNDALKIKPRSAEARTALEQTRHQLTRVNINTILASARELESEERWHDALDKYNAALKIDGKLAEALDGKKQSSLRSKLHDKLENLLKQPARLYDAKVYDETVEFEKKIQKLSAPGPVLRKQLDSLALLLDKANTPVQFTLQSDNQTKVTLRKVAELGTFAEKSMTLRPGKYVAIGIRQGYRDVRVEFLLDPDKPLRTIVVQAAEKIALGR
ncbi:MAG: hypothetical protein GKR93_19200 [Gammaproteobacteria bacterium]|nr:hypothetical protein [Gammaproteobacteria bacterium]